MDSDSDGCYDVVEAGYTDQNDDGILGDNPISTDPVTGLITSGIDGYTLPINDDYIIGAPIVIDVQPETEYIVCENGSVQITIQSTTIDEYQWQSSTDGINWSDLIDNIYFSGVNSATLQIIDIPLSLDNFQFRALVDRDGFGCILYSE